ncbi:UDP-N-acetylmuramate:L-alanyl-gamma-D-glutamyl-meso-diaminopimelate ligase [Gayadomonas joobiniege]|uniref:UDP-N-acetylmuramate:L-alanyl-gamma-D-glutamyl- meso-diaminopimelate ligase n=1 Tax=Gayadomonas joobiniege TaxID=1234606 RepID=UPI000474C760|nr:UDP-N-acetylmuramate:L-alanyl-gamma-D-glutamyl-meso-diaminopimelate ligase [Gayadomonas joobiniege]
MHIHILGICGTFMGSLAILARQLGHKVTGSDQNVYPPMSTQLAAQGIELIQGYDPSQLDPEPDLVIIGNAMSRGNPVVEAVLERNLAYQSGPQWLFEHVLKDKWVVAVSGTHGKTTTTSMLAWILEDNGCQPGFLIGGVAQNFNVSARLGNSIFFVIEADEYDTAFFDKRSKFVHYHPRTLVINNLEFDHADIFSSLADIQTQFHHMLRMLPQSGRVIYPANDANIEAVFEKGLWSEKLALGDDWEIKALAQDWHTFELLKSGHSEGILTWSLIGQHNAMNAAMAILAAHHCGVRVADAIQSLARFISVKRRLELISDLGDIQVYDDFAHHPSAIKTTLDGLVASGRGPVTAILEPRSNSMKMGVFKHQLADALQGAEQVYLYQDPELTWSLTEVQAAVIAAGAHCHLLNNVDKIAKTVAQQAKAGEQIVIMSNGGFGGLQQKLVDQLKQYAANK